MRDIKFRAWDSKKLQTVTAITYDYDDLFLPENVERQLYKIRIELANGDALIIMPGEHTALMQYTGLKDKNGIDIYEGDVLNVPDRQWRDLQGNWHDYPMEVVEWDGLGWQPFLDYDNSGAPSIKNKAVIGNIYENPELLKGEISGY